MSEGVSLRVMTAADLPFAHSLRAMAGWNQTLQDWQRLLALAPDGCFLAERGGQPAGTATTTGYETHLAWIGMVIVHPDFRGQGIGTALLEHCLRHLESRGIPCVKLDATPLGKPIYERLGFRDEWTLARWEVARPGPPTRASSNVRALRSGDMARVLELDEQAFGVSRRKLIEGLARQSERALVVEEAGDVAGYGLLRRGERANYLGPMVCSSAAAAPGLAAQLLSGLDERPVFWDIPDQIPEAVRLAEAAGFKRQRPLTRMFRGDNRFPGQPRFQWAIADPAAG